MNARCLVASLAFCVSLTTSAFAQTDDPAVYVRQSQIYASANRPAAALAAIERALALRPGDPDYLQAAAVLATWKGDYRIAALRYRQLRVVRPADPDIALRLARVSAWSGDSTAAVEEYRRFLEIHPEAAGVWLELARVESWLGRSTAALGALNEYRQRFGDSREYALALARVLAGAGRPTRAVVTLDPLYRQDPRSYDVNLARATAFAMRRSVGNAREALDLARRVNPATRETRDAERLVRTMIGSSVEPSFSLYGDSDRLQVARFSPSGSWTRANGMRITAGYSQSVLHASAGSGLDRRSGGAARHDHLWGGLAQTFGGVTLSGRVGAASADGRRMTPYTVGASWRASDSLSVGVQSSRGFVAISPRTIDLGVTERRLDADAAWMPTLTTWVDAQAVIQDLSDGNRRWELRVSPRRAVTRNGWMNLDIGFSTYHLMSARDLSNGYYDPRHYEAYQATAFPYFKVSENVGLSLSLAAGPQRERSRPFTFGASAAGEATFGIYRAWLLRASGSVTRNLRRESGAFNGYGGSLALVRRF